MISETGNKNFILNGELYAWNKQHGLGIGFDSSTGFKLPTGSDRSPDAAWIQKERWEALPEAMRKRFAAIAPDFVAEIRSGDQDMRVLEEKMEEYMESGCRLGWLIDPINRITLVYSANEGFQTVPFDDVLQGGEVLIDFKLRLSNIF